MGLFDKVVKKGLEGAVGDLASSLTGAKGASDALGRLTDLAEGLGIDVDGDGRTGTAQPAAVAQAQSTPMAQQTSQAAPVYSDIRADLPDILHDCFGAYQVEQNIQASQLGVGLSPCKPYDYCLFAGGAPAAVIMLTDHNRDNNAAFRNAKAGAAQAGIPFINFYTHMPNEPQYVVARIKGFLG